MAQYDFRGPRLYVESPLHAGATIALDHGQTNYLANVMRSKAGDALLLFNGRDGEWRATIRPDGKRSLAVSVVERTRAQPAPGTLHLLFAPLKHARLDYMVQKAVEMGAARLTPILTRHTQVARVNLERMRANAIEAAEQCGILALPRIDEPISFAAAVGQAVANETVIFCDEDAAAQDPVAALARENVKGAAPIALAVFLGPEGGFAEDERAMLLKLPNVVRLSLGPRVLRADTAAVAALALVQSVLGDWCGAGSPSA